MNADEIRPLLLELLGSITGLDAASITNETDVREDLGIDSIDAVELLVLLERQTGVRFEVEQFDEITTVGDIEAFAIRALDGAPGSGERTHA